MAATAEKTETEKTETETAAGGGGGGDSMAKTRTPTGLLSLARSATFSFERTDTMITIGKLKLRGKTDDLPQDWWFASTAIPLLAATIGPMANVLSIAALVTKWRVTLPDNGQLPAGTDDNGIDIPDPKWEVILNAISLACGVFGNLCLLVNFTRRVRYIIALPLSIVSWYMATGILIGIVAAMNQYAAPVRPGETYSQGFWYAIIAAVLYLIGSMILMINMLGYFLGHYPQHFDLDDDQRTLILQTMMFFMWLAGGAGVFARICGFSYVNALYYCDVTVLTVGFGDVVPTNDAARGFLIPYSVIGIIFLGLMINSIRKFAIGMSKDKIIKKHQLRTRKETFGRTVTSEKELRERLGLPPRRDSATQQHSARGRKPSTAQSLAARKSSLEQYGHFDMHGRTVTFHEHRPKVNGGRGGAGNHGLHPARSRDTKVHARKDSISQARRHDRRQKLIILREEKDRFDTMREIQANTSKFKQYTALAMSALAFGILWCVGAAVFYVAEKRIQDMSYFESLYFCYVSLLTIGYGDFSPRSNAGKPFFVVWSLVAIPTMTILISAMSDTVVSAINRGTFTLADWTVMPKAGVWHDFLESHPRLRDWLALKTEERQQKKRIERGFTVQDPDEEAGGATGSPNSHSSNPFTPSLTLEKLAEESPTATEHELARKLSVAIKHVAHDLRLEHAKKYSYEEWVEFTRLIRFSRGGAREVEQEEEEEGLVEWDWIGEDSPMLADVTESEWVLERLCESLQRYTRKQARERNTHDKPHHRHQKQDPDSAIALDSPASPASRNNTHHHSENIHTYPSHPGPRVPGTTSALHHTVRSPSKLEDEMKAVNEDRKLESSSSESTAVKEEQGENQDEDEKVDGELKIS